MPLDVTPLLATPLVPLACTPFSAASEVARSVRIWCSGMHSPTHERWSPPRHGYGLVELVMHRTLRIRDDHERGAAVHLIKQDNIRVITSGHSRHSQTNTVVPNPEAVLKLEPDLHRLTLRELGRGRVLAEGGRAHQVDPGHVADQKTDDQ